MPYLGFLWSHSVALYPRTPGFNKPLQEAAKPTEDLMVAHTPSLSALLHVKMPTCSPTTEEGVDLCFSIRTAGNV